MENQMPEANAPQRADPQPPARPAGAPAETASNVKPAPRNSSPANNALTATTAGSNAAPKGKPQGLAQTR